jgi:hypothetical protein
MSRSEEYATHAPRLPWWQDLRWITAGIVVVLLGLLVWGLFGPEPPLTVSRETTYLTAPLAADGLPDYEAALLALYGPAPPPDDNAAVLLLQTCWPLGIDGAHLAAVCEALGIPGLPPPESLVLDPRDDAAAGVTREMIDAALDRPWTAEHLPAVAAWLTKNEAQIDRLVAAADRPHYWLPSPSLLDGRPEPLWGIRPPEQQLRGVAEVLRYRAMWHVGENRPAAAWRDIRAIRCLARLVVTPPGRRPQFAGMQYMVLGFHLRAADATRQLLAMPDLPAELLAAIRQDLEGPGPTVALSASVAGKRLWAIDAAVWLARRTPGGRRVRMKLAEDHDFSLSIRDPALLTSLDWNLILERLNTRCDELESAWGLPTHQARIDAMEAQQRVSARAVSAWARPGAVLLQACSRGHRSDRFADRVDLCPGWSGIFYAATICDAQCALAKTAAALAAWKADRAAGETPYPETLSALVPKYLAAVPLDPFSDKPFVYERRGEGYLLASVGTNGVYDGGNDMHRWIVGGEWQTTEQDVDYSKSDLVVRMPMPPPAAPPSARP